MSRNRRTIAPRGIDSLADAVFLVELSQEECDNYWTFQRQELHRKKRAARRRPMTNDVVKVSRGFRKIPLRCIRDY
ncbi:unnamed protein product [Leptosia nina]|uniref:Ribosomal protein S14 n=1 Tax=Leptosia nina TaxID=320188 RepID=A0AAV1J5S5_9NEOP